MPINPSPAYILANVLPAYRQKLKQEVPTPERSNAGWTNWILLLQDCFEHVDWDMFQFASDGDIEVYLDTIMCFIKKYIEDVSTKTILFNPNPKPWINNNVCMALNA